MSRNAIIAENISKRYRIGLREDMHDSISGAIASFIKYPIANFKRLRKLSNFSENGDADDILWALRDVSFEVKEGAVLGRSDKRGDKNQREGFKFIGGRNRFPS